MDIATLNTLMVAKWRLMSHEEWAETCRHLPIPLQVDHVLDRLMTFNSPKWSAVCDCKQMTAFLRKRIMTNVVEDLIVNDQYVIFHRLGQGAFGTTYLAYDRLGMDDVEPVVVVKTTGIRPGDPLYDRFLREYSLLGEMTSRYFPKVKYFYFHK